MKKRRHLRLQLPDAADHTLNAGEARLLRPSRPCHSVSSACITSCKLPSCHAATHTRALNVPHNAFDVLVAAEWWRCRSEFTCKVIYL